MKPKQIYKTPDKNYVSEQELVKRLFLTVFYLIAVIGLLFITIKYFGPKVGAIFGLISIHRDEDQPKDVVAPTAPIFSHVPSSTNKDKLILNGIAEPASTVKLYVNGPEAESTTADNEGLFTFANIKIDEGNNIIFAKTFDPTGNESGKSEVLIISKDTKAPEIEIEEPENGSTVKNLNKRILIKGKLDENASVKINERFAVVRPDLTFELLLGVEEGTIEIKIEAVDKANNKAEKELTIKYEKKSF